MGYTRSEITVSPSFAKTYSVVRLNRMRSFRACPTSEVSDRYSLPPGLIGMLCSWRLEVKRFVYSYGGE